MSTLLSSFLFFLAVRTSSNDGVLAPAQRPWALTHTDGSASGGPDQARDQWETECLTRAQYRLGQTMLSSMGSFFEHIPSSGTSQIFLSWVKMSSPSSWHL